MSKMTKRTKKQRQIRSEIAVLVWKLRKIYKISNYEDSFTRKSYLYFKNKYGKSPSRLKFELNLWYNAFLFDWMDEVESFRTETVEVACRCIDVLMNQTPDNDRLEKIIRNIADVYQVQRESKLQYPNEEVLLKIENRVIKLAHVLEGVSVNENRYI